MTGYNTNQVACKKFAGLGAEMDLEVLRNVHFNLMVNTFLVQEAGTGGRFSVYSGYGLGVGYLSIIGPVKAGMMYGNHSYESNNSKIKGYVSIGYNF
jgi:hypothetical protein